MLSEGTTQVSQHSFERPPQNAGVAARSSSAGGGGAGRAGARSWAVHLSGAGRHGI